MLKEKFYTEEELAEELRKPKATLQAWRHRRVGPAWTKIGKSVVYGREAVEAWLSKQTVNPSAA